MIEVASAKAVNVTQTREGAVGAPKLAVRFRALDGLRGVAALLVVFYHIELQSAQWPNHLTDNVLARHGYLAVDLFFILSGLVISSNYSLRINSFVEAKQFLFLRFFRLYPLHIAILAPLVLLECVKLATLHFALTTPSFRPPFAGDRSLGGLATSLLLINGWHVSDVAVWNGPSWSISCEFAAYLVFAALVLAGVVKNKIFFVLGLVPAILSYPTLALFYGTLDLTANWGIARCFAGFFLGMFIYELMRSGRCFLAHLPPQVANISEIAGAAAVILAISFTSGAFVVLVIPLLVLLIAILQLDRGPVSFFLNMSPVQFLGRISYSIYMVHVLIVLGVVIILNHLVPLAIHQHIVFNHWIGDLLVVVTVTGVVAAATLTYTYIEEPARLFGRRHFPGSK